MKGKVSEIVLGEGGSSSGVYKDGGVKGKVSETESWMRGGFSSGFYMEM